MKGDGSYVSLMVSEVSPEFSSLHTKFPSNGKNCRALEKRCCMRIPTAKIEIKGETRIFFKMFEPFSEIGAGVEKRCCMRKTYKKIEINGGRNKKISDTFAKEHSFENRKVPEGPGEKDKKK